MSSLRYNSKVTTGLGPVADIDFTDLSAAAYEGLLVYDLGKVYFSNGSVWVSIAEEAQTANTANFAEDANTANLADLATLARLANVAIFANTAALATFANTAQLANTANLASDSLLLQGYSWASPAAIGSDVANSATFTDVIVSGNLTVQDTLIYLDVANINVQNNFIVINSDQANPSLITDSGVVLQR
jgi:hypothetical protein